MTSVALGWRPTWPPLAWLPAPLLLIAVTALAGPALGSNARPIFLLGSALAGWLAWSRSPGAHLQTVLILFSFTPMLRRLVDLSAGFDPGGIMIAGPLLALLAPLPGLRKLTRDDLAHDPAITPFLVFGACVTYASVLTMAQGEWSQAASGALKWGAPFLYALALYLRAPDASELLHDATAAFIFILPVTGLYGIYQYVDPPLWDRYWLIFSAITSAGRPEAYEVRVFSTMHGPAVFATFTAIGLILIYVLRSSWQTRLAIIPAILALALSLYRTAWISLAASILFCLLFAPTRRRAVAALALVSAAVALSLWLTPFGDVIGDRLGTLGDASNDGSGNERLGEFANMWNQTDSGLFGTGFISSDVGTAGATPLDGMIATCWWCMGIFAGLICLSSMIYVIAICVAAAMRRRAGRESVLLGAVACGWLIQLPLAAIASGELGFLFWTTSSLALCMRRSGSRL